MRETSVESVVLSKSIDNSGVVREVDPRTSRDLVALLLLVGILVGGLVLYAWPHFQMRQTSMATEQMLRERDRLVEENRKLRLEKASLENLARVQVIAERNLGLTIPAADHLVVVEAPQAPTGERADLATEQPTAGDARN